MFQGRTETRLNKSVCTSVLMFLLAPDHLSSGVLTQLSLQGNEWEWSQLLKSHDGDVLLAKLLALINQIIINLARAEDHLARGSW
jgi:hypothetical protein